MSNIIKISSQIVSSSNIKHEVLEKIKKEISASFTFLIPYRKGNQWGFCDKNKNIIIDCIYDSAYHFTNEGLAAVRKNEFWGFIDKSGNNVIPIQYRRVTCFRRGISRIIIDNKIGFLNTKGEIIIQVDYDEALLYELGIALRKGSKWGFSTYEGNLICSIEYDKVYPSLQLSLVIAILNSEYLIFDFQGKQIYNEFIQQYEVLNNNYFIIKSNGKYGIIDTIGTVILPTVCKILQKGYLGDYGFIYLKLEDVSGYICLNQLPKNDIKEILYEKISQQYGENKEYITAKLKDKWGVLNIYGEVVLPFIYENIYGFSDERLSAVEKNNKWGFINQKGEVVIPFIYDKVSYHKNGIAEVSLNSKWGCIDSVGNMIIPIIYDDIVAMHFFEDYCQYDLNNLIKVKLNGKWGLFDRHGNNIVPIQYGYISYYTDSLEIFYSLLNGKWGGVDAKGEIKIPFIFNNLEDMFYLPADDKIFKIKKGELWYFYNQQGKFLGAYRSFSIKNDVLLCYKEDKWGIIDKDGKIILDFEFDDAGDFSEEGLVELLVDFLIDDGQYAKWGITNFKGKIVLPFIYEDAKIIANGIVAVSKNNMWGAVNIHGETLVPFVYDEIFCRDKNLIKVTKDRLCGLINIYNEVLLPLVYEDIEVYKFEREITQIRLNKKYGIINSNGKIVLPALYDNLRIEEFHYDKLLIIEANQKWAVIDHKGNMLVDFVFEKMQLSDFTLPSGWENLLCHKCIAGADNKFIVSNIKSSLHCLYDVFTLSSCNQYALVSKEGNYGFINNKLEIVIPIIYDKPFHFEDGLARISHKNKSGYIDLHNNQYWED